MPQLFSSFDVMANKAMDSRTVVATYNDLSNIATAYEGLKTFVRDEKKTYVCTSYVDGVATWEEESAGVQVVADVTERDDLDVKEGLLVYVESLKALQVYSDSKWSNITNDVIEVRSGETLDITNIEDEQRIPSVIIVRDDNVSTSESNPSIKLPQGSELLANSKIVIYNYSNTGVFVSTITSGADTNILPNTFAVFSANLVDNYYKYDNCKTYSFVESAQYGKLNNLLAAIDNNSKYLLTAAEYAQFQELAAKSITITAGSTNGTIVFSDGTEEGTSTVTVYTHPTDDGNKHVPATGTENDGKFLKAGNAAGSMVWSDVTQEDVGLGNVNNTADKDKPVSDAQQTAIDNAKDAAISSAETKAGELADAAKDAAISTASDDATTKANQALSDAKAYAESLFASNDAMVFKGIVYSAPNFYQLLENEEFSAGWTYKVGETIPADTLWPDSPVLENGDMIICIKDRDDNWGTASGNGHANEYFNVVQSNIDGAVTGPTSATKKNIAIFDAESGKVITDGGVSVEDIAQLDSPEFTGDPKVPTADENDNDTTIANTAFVHKETHYTNTTKTLSAVGGIPAGSTFDNMDIKDIIDALLYPYTKPTVSLSSSSTKVLELGDSITPTFTVNVGRKSKDITSVGLYIGSTLVESNVAVQAAGGSQSSIKPTEAITSNTTYTVKVSDGTETVTSSGVSFTFVNPFYYGVVASAPATSDAVKALTKKVEAAKGSKDLTLTTTADAKKFCIAIPSSNSLTKVVDLDTNIDYTADFECCDSPHIEVTTLAGTNVAYKVYTFKEELIAGTKANLRFTIS